MQLTRSQMNKLLKQLEGPLRRAFERAIKLSLSRASIAAMEAAIEAGNLDALIKAAGLHDGMWSGLTEEIRKAYMQAGIFVLAADVPMRLGFEFNINNPRAELWLRNSSSQLITGKLLAEQRGAIQVMLQNAMAKGLNPRTTALDIVGRIAAQTGRRSGGVIGLTQQQAQYITNAGDDLLDFNTRYFQRRLRDRRFDSIVRQSFENGTPLPKATREKITARYSDRMLKHRGDNIARTETLAALNEASDEALRQIVDEGLAPVNAVTRIWRHSFSLNERPGHLRMSGQKRGINEYFHNPLTGAMLKHPGEGSASEVVNCRCYIEHKIDFVAVERRAA